MEAVAIFAEPKTANDFNGQTEIRNTENGRTVVYVLLAGEGIAKIKEGTGADVEKATLIAGGNQSKYFSALMAGTTEIDGKPVIMEDLAEMPMKNYMRIQAAFADINF